MKQLILALVASSLALVGWDGPAAATAQPRPWEAATEEQRARARALVARADEQYNDASVSRAVELYLEALAIWDHPAIHAPLAIAYNELDKPVEAYEHMQAAFAFGSEPLGSNHEVAQKRFEMIKKKIGTIEIKNTTAGAEIKLNGDVVLTDAGVATKIARAGQRHIVTATRKGMQTLTREPDVVGNETVAVVITMQPIQPKYVRRYKKTWVPYTVAAAGVVVAGFGGLLYAQALGDKQQFNDLYGATCPTGCARAQWDDRNPLLSDLDASMKRQSALGIAGFAVGGALTATGITLLILNKPRAVWPDEAAPGAPAAPARLSVVPIIGRDLTGLATTWSF
ncbi:MAG: hypothetical protein IPL79_08320 [Myxococcales bacterium]|nr:hypothetical protein [Myxococcales bacterium]